MKVLCLCCELDVCLPHRRGNEANMIRTNGASRRWESRNAEEEEEKKKRRSSSRSSRTRWRWRRKTPEMLHLLSAVSVWLVTGTTISSLNKWIFAVYNFRYPLLLSALHMLTAIVVDYGLIKCCFGRCSGSDPGAVERELSPGAKCKVFLLSLTFCASIAFGNVGLNYVQLSFAQMIYTTTPLFTLAISSLVLGKQHHILKYTAMMPICLGASFSVMGELQFDQTGCFFVFAATMLRGVKSIQQSILLQEEKINSVFLLYLMAIPSFCILAVAALVLENWTGLQWPLQYDRRLWGFILLSCLGSVLYNLASCCVIRLTSAVTLHVLGNLSVVGNLLLSQMLFGCQLSALSCAGAVLTLSGIVMYQNSEFIAGYLDARRSRVSAAMEDERDDKVSDAEEEQSPELEPFLERSEDERRSADLNSELYCDLESSSELCQDLDASSEVYEDLEPTSELCQDREPSSQLYQELKTSIEQSSGLYQDLEPSSELCKDVEPFSELYQNLKPSSELCEDVDPASELCEDVDPASELCQDPEPSTEQYEHLEAPSKLYQGSEPSSKLCADLESSPELYQDLEPSPDLNSDLESTNYDLEPSSELDQCPELSFELCEDTEQCSELYQTVELSSELYLDLEPSTEQYEDLETPSELYQDLEPSSKLCEDLEPSSELYQDQESSLDLNSDLESSMNLQNDVEPTPELYSVDSSLSPNDLEPSVDSYCDLESTSGLCRHLEPSSNLYQNLQPSLESIPDLLADTSRETVTERHETLEKMD